MTSRAIRRISVAVVVFALGLNITLNLHSYQQSLVTERTAAWTEVRYQIWLDIDRLASLYSDLLHSASQHAPVAELAATMKNIHARLDSLKMAEAEHPEQIAALSVVQQDLLETEAAPDPKRIIQNAYHTNIDFRRVRGREMALLRDRLDEAGQHSQEARSNLVLGSGVDMALVLLLIALFLKDIRNRRQTESSLRQTIAHLDETNRYLGQLNSSRSDSFKSTVHDLKNPLGSIRGFAELILEDAENPQSVTEMTRVIQNVSNRTLDLINSMIEKPADEPAGDSDRIQAVNVTEYLHRVCADLTAQVRVKRQVLEFKPRDAELMVRGYGNQLKDVFQNLVSNAVKFSPPGARIQVRCSRDGAVAKIEIEDDGPGLTADDKLKVFQKYQTLSAKPTGDEMSTGLGLFFVKEIVELHHGHVSVHDSIAGRGACFTVELPLFAAAGPTAIALRSYEL